MDEIGVFIIDGHPMIRAGLQTLLASMSGITVVGDSNTANALWRELDLGGVTVVLADLYIAGESPAFDVIRRVHTDHPSVRIIILVDTIPKEILIATIQAGADGIIRKDASPGQIELAIRAVAEGYQFFHPSVMTAMTEALEEKPEELPVLDGIPYLPALTARENEVLRLLSTGLSNQAIADRLIITEATVKTHLNNIYSKLKLTDRLQAVFYAMRVGLAPSLSGSERESGPTS